jgi:hypothetical protein
VEDKASGVEYLELGVVRALKDVLHEMNDADTAIVSRRVALIVVG